MALTYHHLTDNHPTVKMMCFLTVPRMIEGYIKRTSRGREATEPAYKHLGQVPSSRMGTLF